MLKSHDPYSAGKKSRYAPILSTIDQSAESALSNRNKDTAAISQGPMSQGLLTPENKNIEGRFSNSSKSNKNTMHSQTMMFLTPSEANNSLMVFETSIDRGYKTNRLMNMTAGGAGHSPSIKLRSKSTSKVKFGSVEELGGQVDGGAVVKARNYTLREEETNDRCCCPWLFRRRQPESESDSQNNSNIVRNSTKSLMSQMSASVKGYGDEEVPAGNLWKYEMVGRIREFSEPYPWVAKVE